VTAAWWTKLHPLTRLALFLTVCLHAALGQEFLPQLLLFAGLLVLLFTCGAAGSHYRLLIWAHVLGLPGTILLFIAIGYEHTHLWMQARRHEIRLAAGVPLPRQPRVHQHHQPAGDHLPVLASMDADCGRDAVVHRRTFRAPFTDGSPADLRHSTLSRVAPAPVGATELVAHHCPVVRISNVPGA